MKIFLVFFLQLVVAAYTLEEDFAHHQEKQTNVGKRSHIRGTFTTESLSTTDPRRHQRMLQLQALDAKGKKKCGDKGGKGKCMPSPTPSPSNAPKPVARSYS